MRLPALYWVLSGAFLVGALLAGLSVGWDQGSYGYPFQGLAVALGVLSATFAFLGDRARREGGPRDSA